MSRSLFVQIFTFFVMSSSANAFQLLQNLQDPPTFVDQGVLSQSITDIKTAKLWIKNFELIYLADASEIQRSDYMIIKASLITDALNRGDYSFVEKEKLNLQMQGFPNSVSRMIKYSASETVSAAKSISNGVLYFGASATNIFFSISSFGLYTLFAPITQDFIDSYFLSSERPVSLSPVDFDYFSYESINSFLQSLNAFNDSILFLESLEKSSLISSRVKNEMLKSINLTKSNLYLQFHKLSIDLQRLGMSGSERVNLIEAQLVLILLNDQNFDSLLQSLFNNSEKFQGRNQVSGFRKISNLRFYRNLNAIKVFVTESLARGVEISKITPLQIARAFGEVGYPDAKSYFTNYETADHLFVQSGAIPVADSVSSSLLQSASERLTGFTSRFRSKSNQCSEYLR